MRSLFAGTLAFVLSVASSTSAGVLEKKALASVEASYGGETLFESLAPERTGIFFESRFENTELWRSLWRQYFIGSIGSGIALGDVNGDTLPDIFFVGKDSPNALYLNRGDFRFEDVSERAGIAISKGIGAGAAMVDIDNDGDLDIYVCYVGSPNQLFVNDGDGTFIESAAEFGLSVYTGSNAPSFADYDKDGDLDLYLQCNYLEESENPAGMPDFLFENRDGFFHDVTAKAGIDGKGQGHAAIWWDYDEDGWPDLYVANDFAPDDRLYRNNGDGTFKDVLRDFFEFAPYSAMGADLGDLNNDGHIDLFVAEMKPRERAYYLQTVGPLTAKLFSIDQKGVSQYMQNVLSANLGGGQFADFGYLAGLEATDWTWAPRLLDLDNDGLLDAFFTNGMARAFHDADLGVRVSKATSRRMQVALYQRSPALEEQNLAFRNKGDFQFEDKSADWGLDLVGVSFAAGAADFDQDGDLDLVVGNWKGPPSIYRNRSSDGRRLIVRLEGRASNRFGLGARIELVTSGGVQVREMVSTRGYMSNDEPMAHFAVGDDEEIQGLRIEWPSGAKQSIEEVEAGYSYRISEESIAIASDERRTLFVRSKFQLPASSFSKEKNRVVNRDQALLPFYEDMKGPPLLLEDLDGDGSMDVVLGGVSGIESKLFRNLSGAGFEEVKLEGTRDSEVSSVLSLDADLDGNKDILLASGGAEQLRGEPTLSDNLYLGNGDGLYEIDSGSVHASIPLATGSMLLCDVDGDGEEELLQAGGPIARTYPLAELNRVFGIHTDGFDVLENRFSTEFGSAGKLTDLKCADLDGDGYEDLLACVEWGGVLYWKGGPGGLGNSVNLLAGERGHWSSLEIGDFNGDGRLDLFVGNLGLNSRFKASPSSEYALYFSKSHVAEPRLFIEAVEDDGAFYPTETRTLHQMYLPEQMAATGSFARFSELTIDEALGADVMSELDKVTLTETRSVLLLQVDDGRFVSKELPHLTQSGRVNDSVVHDFDGDGDLDIVLVNESISPQPWVALTPERSHILYLENEGGAEFSALLPGESGLAVEQGQAKRLAVGDLDGDGVEELVVSASDGPVVVFETN